MLIGRRAEPGRDSRAGPRPRLTLQDVPVPEGDSQGRGQGLPGPLLHLLTRQVRHRVVEKEDAVAAVPLSLRHRRASLGEGLRADDGCRRPPLLDLWAVVHTPRAAGRSIADGVSSVARRLLPERGTNVALARSIRQEPMSLCANGAKLAASCPSPGTKSCTSPASPRSEERRVGKECRSRW